MSLTKRLNLRDGEEVIAVVRRSLLAHAGALGLGVVCVIGAFLLLAPLLGRGAPGAIIFAILLAFGAVVIARSLWFWYGTAFIVTPHRVIDLDQRGFFHRSIAEARFERIEDISVVVRGFLATIFRLGVIRVQTSGASALLEIRHVRRSERVHELLGRLQHEAGGGRRTSPDPVRANLDALDDAELLRLHERVERELERRGMGEYATSDER